MGDAIAATARVVVAPLGRRRSAKALARLSGVVAPTVRVETPHGEIRFVCPTEECARVPTRFLKWEPETLAWIDDHVTPGACLWDIGGHIGSFSLYAGAKLAKTGGEVIAFEPSAATYGVLNENIRVSGLSKTVRAFCVAVSDGTKAGLFHISSAGAAQDGNAFGEPENVTGRFEPAFSQAMLSFSVDDLIATFGLRSPDFLKLDVDSIELDILRGATRALKGIRSILIEIESARSSAWVEGVEGLFAAAGFEREINGHDRNRVYVNKGLKAAS